MRALIILTALTAASPAFAADGPFFSLRNTEFVVLLAFILIIAVMMFLKVPSKIGEMLDARAHGIQSELDEARALREEAQELLASYERKQREVQEQADRIVEQAKHDASEAAKAAKDDLENSIARRMKAAEEQIAQAESGAVREVRDRAIAVAISAAQEVVAKNMKAADSNKLIDDAIKEVGTKLH